MYWNMRRVRTVTEQGVSEVGIYEVYYDTLTEEPTSRAVNPVSMAVEEDFDSLEDMMDKFKDAMEMDILDDSLFEGDEEVGTRLWT